MSSKRIIVMTESSKFKNNCVAGIDTDTGKWIRVVSDDEETHGALTDEDLMYEDGTKCQVLDIVDVPYVEEVPTRIQPENILIDRDQYIENDGVATLEDVLRIHPGERHNNIFGGRFSTIKEERLDRQGVNYSLMLIKVSQLVINRKENNEGKKKLKATFVYNNDEHEDIAVTDSDFFDVEEKKEIPSAYLVLSLGEPYNGNCYKFVAKIFPVE